MLTDMNLNYRFEGSRSKSLDLSNQCFNPLMGWKIGQTSDNWLNLWKVGPDWRKWAPGHGFEGPPCPVSLPPGRCVCVCGGLRFLTLTGAVECGFLSQIKDKTFGESSSITHLDFLLSLLIVFGFKFRDQQMIIWHNWLYLYILHKIGPFLW